MVLLVVYRLRASLHNVTRPLHFESGPQTLVLYAPDVHVRMHAYIKD